MNSEAKIQGMDDILDHALREKFDTLKRIIIEMQRVVIGFSGGVDSTLLLKVCVETLGKENVLAVIGRSDTYPEREYEEAQRIAREIGATITEVETRETDVLKFKENPPDRCYFCKTELFTELRIIADAHGIAWILDGTHADDSGDFRRACAPSAKAVSARRCWNPGSAKRTYARFRGTTGYLLPRNSVCVPLFTVPIRHGN